MDKFQSGKYKFSSVKPLFLIGNYVIGERGKEINILVDELIKYKVLIKDLISREVCRIVKTIMVTCGMYDASGEFAVHVGVPAKSGVGGGIIATVVSYRCLQELIRSFLRNIGII
mgnify:CR=1 FL=1